MDEDKSAHWTLRLSLLLYIPIFYYMFNAEHYHIFWKSIIALFILIYFHIYWYVPILLESHKVNNLNELYEPILKKYKTRRILFVTICLNGILQTIFLLLTVGHNENRVKTYLFPGKHQEWLDIYDMSEYFTLGVIPFLLYFVAKYLKNSTN
ncbi:MAG: hypothetical protein RL092_2055 [Bacteroidota bacterium]|jgi:hypothetical protein